MKKVAILLCVFLFAGVTVIPQIVHADLEWKIIRDLDLKAAPLDVACSPDGKWLFILTLGEILVYSLPEGTIAGRISIDKEFDRIASLPRGDMFTIASSTKKVLQVILFEALYKIDVAGLPFKGPKDASVTLVVFDDYQ